MGISFSIIIPVYKVEKYLEQCVNSVLNQTYKNFEIILVDDGSPDECPKICDRYAQKNSRVKVVHKENGGVSDARNLGMSYAFGDYIIFIDGDDFWKNSDVLHHISKRVQLTNPDVLNFLHEKFYENNNSFVPYQIFNDSMPIIKNKEQQLDYLTSNSLYISSPWNKVIRTNIAKDNKFIKGMLSEDIEWCARLLCKANSFDFFNEVLYCYRQREGSITKTCTQKNCDDVKKAIFYCLKYAGNCDKNIKEYIYRYTAYQFSTFVAIQAMTDNCPKECIDELAQYRWLFKYHCGNKKVKVLYFLCKIMGYKNLCRLARITKKIWLK